MSGFWGNVKGQEEQRRVETFLDQHGREYVANVEIKTGDPCEVLRPLGWVAPIGPEWLRGLLTPPEPYRVMVLRHERARKRYQIHIDYRSWLRDVDLASDAWDRKLQAYVKSITTGEGALTMVKSPPALVLSDIGIKPFPPRILIQSMAAGNPWALGLTDKIPSKVEALLEQLHQELGSRTRRHAVDLDNGEDPFADEDEVSAVVAESLPPDPLGDDGGKGDPLAYLDLEEDIDPEATGGRRVKSGRKPKLGA